MANEVRKGIVTGIHSGKSRSSGADHFPHADVFTYLYFEEMNIDPKDPKNPEAETVSS